MIQETERRTEDHTRERDAMRKKKRDAMAKKNKIVKSLDQRKAHLAEAEDKKAQADRYVQDLQARGDGNDVVAKKLQQWHDKKSTLVESMEQSQAAQRDATRAYKSAMVGQLLKDDMAVWPLLICVAFT